MTSRIHHAARTYTASATTARMTGHRRSTIDLARPRVGVVRGEGGGGVAPGRQRNRLTTRYWLAQRAPDAARFAASAAAARPDDDQCGTARVARCTDSVVRT